MKLEYIKGVATLSLSDGSKCTGCGRCVNVCPHNVFRVENGKAVIQNKDACMECGACTRNCPVQAIRVTPGMGCAVAILGAWINRALGRKFFSECC